MKPLALGIVCFPSFGGSGVVATDLAVGLAARGHDVHVLASAAPFRKLPVSRHLHFHPIHVPTYPLLEHAPYTLAVASALVEVSTRFKLDIIHTHYAMPHAASAYLATQMLGSAAPRSVITLHGTDVTHIGRDPSYLSVMRFAIDQAHGVTTPSTFLKNEAYRLLGLRPKQDVRVLANFVDTSRYQPASERSRKAIDALFEQEGLKLSNPGSAVLCHVSNFRAVKRITDLIDVLEQIRSHMPARLVLVGDGPERPHAAQYAKDRGMHQHICFLGKQTDFAETLRHTDVFVLPSESESFGLAALEALSCGVPVVGYRVGGLPEVVTQDVGCLVEPFSIAALAQATLTLLQDTRAYKDMSAAARLRATKNFGQDAAMQHYEQYYHHVLQQFSFEPHKQEDVL